MAYLCQKCKILLGNYFKNNHIVFLEVIKKHDANKEGDVSEPEKETKEVHGLIYKGGLHAQRPPPKKKFERSRLQGKHLEQEQESQGTLPRGKNQVR